MWRGEHLGANCRKEKGIHKSSSSASYPSPRRWCAGSESMAAPAWRLTLHSLDSGIQVSSRIDSAHLPHCIGPEEDGMVVGFRAAWADRASVWARSRYAEFPNSAFPSASFCGPGGPKLRVGVTAHPPPSPRLPAHGAQHERDAPRE